MIESEYTDKEQLDAWIEWKEKCAWEKCSAPSQKILASKGDKRYIAELNRRNIPINDNRPIQLGWTYFESHAISKTFSKSDHKDIGKSYKIGIFNDVLLSDDPPLKVLNGKFKNYLRSAINELHKMDMAQNDETRFISFNKEYDDNENSLENLISRELFESPENETALNDLRRIAEKLAIDIEESLSIEERIACIVNYNDMIASDPKILQILNSNKSRFSDKFCKGVPRKILLSIKGQEYFDNNLIDELISNLNLSASNKSRKYTKNNIEIIQTLQILISYINNYLEQFAEKRIIRESSSEKVYDTFLSYCKDRNINLQCIKLEGDENE